jgi:pentose-5-phosphate-3-epimerase
LTDVCAVVATSVANYLYDKLDMLLIMTITPGAGASHSFPWHIRAAREKLNHVAPTTRIQVDGGEKRSKSARHR